MIQAVSSITVAPIAFWPALRPRQASSSQTSAASPAAHADTAPLDRTLGPYENLSPDQQRQVQQLQQADRRVRQHEAAHQAAAGSYGRGAPTYQYRTGPDGRRYAVAGEVQIDTSPVPGDPEATIRKMQQVRRAALAPGDPSAQDRAVAAQASQVEQQARAELAHPQTADRSEGSAPEAAQPGVLGQIVDIYV